ncbi:fatty acyl-CoA reductase 3-like [Prunus yedoensis var. nudiflora]|uniref:Fatty acyl-CoA reductase 3-like n=1 Tax=Prunus yedoensis var. nudiflora TaxID=2094558 RepID=A0A314ZFS0_PRUYE|nr:fatty acyl-CoA reductase 3-like [Prunus yedoensis var. nudiflora]
MATFRMYMKIRFLLPLEKLKWVMRLVELYEPYMLFKGIFDDNNAEELRRITRERFH